MPGAVYFILSNTLTIYISVLFARILAGDGPCLRRVIIAISNFAFIIYFAVIITGSVGVLSSKSILIVLGAVAIYLTYIARHRLRFGKKCLPGSTGLFQGNKDAVLLKFSLVLFSGFAAEWICRAFILGTYFGPDDLVYHASIAAQWIVDKRISIVPFSYHAYYPFNAEIMSLWFMLPFQNDSYTSITSFYWILLSVAAIISITRSMGYSAVSSVLVAAVFIASTGVQGTSVQKILQSFSANDIVGPSMLLAAMAMLFTSRQLQNRDKLINSLYVGLMVGFAIGAKVSFAPVIPVILLWLLLSKNGSDSLKERSGHIMFFVLGLVLTGGFWYARNILITGNPLFPAEVGPFNGPFSMDDQYRTKLISWILHAPVDLEQWFKITRSLGDWPLHFAFISTAGYITAIYGLLKHRAGSSVMEYKTLLLVTGLILFFSFFLLPFSATTNHPDTGLKAANRYVIFPFAAGLLLFCGLISEKNRSANLWRILTFFSLLALAIYEKKLVVLTLFAITAAVVYFRPLEEMLTKVLKLKHFYPLLLIAGFVFLVFWHPYKKQLTDKNYYSSIGPAGRVFREIETFPDASRIGFFGTLPFNNTPFYRLFGRRLQMVPVPLDYDGSVPGPLHTKPLEINSSWWDEWDKLHIEVNERDFQFNIWQSTVQYVIIARFPYNKWPVQYNIFKNMANATQIYNDRHSAIWKLLKVKPGPKAVIDNI